MSKTYIDGTSCKAITWEFWEFFNISVNVEKIQQYANEKGYINMTMSKRKEVGQYWDTHYFTLNEWVPDWEKKDNSNIKPMKWDSDISISDIPF